MELSPSSEASSYAAGVGGQPRERPHAASMSFIIEQAMKIWLKRKGISL
jgi:hypothetical protein